MVRVRVGCQEREGKVVKRKDVDRGTREVFTCRPEEEEKGKPASQRKPSSFDRDGEEAKLTGIDPYVGGNSS